MAKRLKARRKRRRKIDTKKMIKCLPKVLAAVKDLHPIEAYRVLQAAETMVDA